ncbi:efflux transporter outer membrane subunit [Sphingomonas astaxanthinifaciens]|uniref:Outer membrane efflux protein n=1 Tax=Sphingomonas astaxanthinifaciens DSM 22298 TaxID=1123267 RepID=A0ABQ5Z6D9_9SPHN|nr:efflux transporter outer membrane subunit [Sphingomonas astaxanthinifaciens]GLR48263.1 outer membrane efflux protein [Sphingomonas astaxanthinifaciens DSM 22298]
MTNHLFLTSLSALALAACATGPDYQATPVSAAAAAPFVHQQGAAVSSAEPAGQWWRLYADPVLDGLVADALAANTDVRVAVGRLAKARALLRETRGQREPQIGVGASAQYGKLPGPDLGQKREDVQVDVGLDVAYELDLFGRVSRSVEAARGDTAAAAEDAQAVRVAVVADTTRAYADAASAAERLAVGERIVALLDRSLALTEKRHQVGLANGLDTARIAALRDQRAAELPLIQAEREAALLRLATLTGRTPRELPPIAAARVSTLRLAQPIPVGDGAGLLARRPDVRAAERRLAAATARIGVATADLYPRITLGGSVGSSGAGLGNIFGGNPLTWLVGPLINWTVNRSAARARVAGSEADAQVALAQFDGSVLTALQETETALSSYRNALARRAALQSASNAAEKAAAITRARQREGDISSLELLDAERTAADAQAALAEADARIATAQIDLFRSLGGTWTQA